jgi:hypothetical protein
MVTNTNPLRQDQTQEQTEVVGGLGLKAFPSHRRLKAVDAEEWSGLPSGIHVVEDPGQMANASTFISPCMSVDESSGWPSQDAWDSMPLATASDWVWDWSEAQHLTQNDNSSDIHPSGPAQETGGFLFESELKWPQSENNGAMFFWGEQPPISGPPAMRGLYTPEEQEEPSFSPTLTGLYFMSAFERQRLEQPFEEPDLPVLSALSPTAKQIEYDSK